MIQQYLVAVVTFMVIDFVWLGAIANKLYRKQLGFLLLDKFNMVAAIIFYLVFLIGLVVFVINPAVKAGSVVQAAGYGALFGFVTYATYDLTNLATIKGWPLTITIVDLIWGAVLAAAVSAIVTAICR